MKKLVIKIVSIAAIFCFTLDAPLVYGTNSSSIQDQIDNNNDAIKDLENEKDKIQNQVNSANKELNDLYSQMNGVSKNLEEASKKVNAFQEKIDAIQSEIDVIQGKIDDKDYEITKKEELIAEKEKELAERDELLSIRLRSYYKNGMSNQYLSFILNSDDLGSFLSNMYSVDKVLSYDKQLMKELKNLQSTLEKEKALLEEDIIALEEERKIVEEKKGEVVEAQKEFLVEQNKYQAQVDNLKGMENKKQSIINNLSAKEKELQDKIGDLTDFNQDLQDKLDGVFDDINNGNGGGSGNSQGETFLRPTNGRVSSEYGKRIHPITGAAGFHTGIDLASSSGTPIKSSKSGTVVFSGWQNGYGNTVIVDHGGGYQTLYAHCSSLKVSKGQKVTRGETIALVGSTGNSTGPHLHFEVRKDGKHQNPRNYISF